jgi:hypothetical protein
MEILHSAIMEAIEGLPNQFLAQLVTSKLAAQGVHLSAGERKQLDRYIKQRGKDAFRIKRWKFWDRQQTKVEFSPGEIEQAEHKFTDFIESRMPDLIQGVAGEVVDSGEFLMRSLTIAPSSREIVRSILNPSIGAPHRF